jgi:hypothetical protein
LVISLYAIGIGRNSWIDVRLDQLSILVDHPEYGFPWDSY